MTERVAHVHDRTVLVLNEAVEDVLVDRLAVGGQPRDLPLVLAGLEAADLGDVGVVVPQRIEGRHGMQVPPTAVFELVDMRGMAVAGAVQRNDQVRFQTAGEVGGNGVRQMV